VPRILVLLAVLAAGLGVGWRLGRPVGDPADKARIQELEGERDALLERIGALEDEVARQQARIAFLRERRRLARVGDVEREVGPDGKVRTRFHFQEVDEDGRPLGPPQEFTVEGDLAYFEALVVKFDEEFARRHDLEPGSTLLLFRRIFGEHRAPAEGYPVDSVGQRPLGYADDPAAAFHDRLWRDFWDYALQPEVLQEAGIRAMHGEAPFVKLEPGREYVLELRSTGGLTIRPEPTLEPSE